MSQRIPEIHHKKLDRIMATTIHLTIREREELYPVFESIGREAHGKVAGPPFAVFHWDTGVEGVEVDAGFPVSGAVSLSGATMKTFEEAEAFVLVHVGPYEELRQRYSMLYTQLYARGIPASLLSREIFQKYDVKNPKKNVTEVQVLVHDWESRLARAVEDLLGAEARAHVMMGSELLIPDSSKEERTRWVREAVERLDKLTDDEQRYDILSRCAHVFPEERIQRLKNIYERTGQIKAVLEQMEQDQEWYETPMMEGTCIRVRKVPYNRKTYEAATTAIDKKNAYCHCPMVRGLFEEMPPSFCYCGSGWYRRLWEGILGGPVRVRIEKTVTKGDDYCEFTIDIPSGR
jgi:effector-binding domain-containing protein